MRTAQLAHFQRGRTMFALPQPAERNLAIPPAAGLGFVGALPAGAVVLQVGPGPAQRAGLQAGDVVTAIGDAHIQSTDDLRQAVRRVGSGTTRYRVRRNDRTLAIDIECPDCTSP